ncbi:MAG: PD40 domain-containing protein, partial [Candidatus Sericytochromatia bacterium]|nr:PD40 domain-containing protein [Candidatus Tanganyikabacteria bacterium]
LFIADVAARKTVPVVAGAPLFPVWSPDSARLLLHPGNQLLMVDLSDGIKVRAIAGGAIGFRTPAWSPDGERIAYAEDAGNAKLHLITADRSGKAVKVEADLDGPVAFLWSPTGSGLAFATMASAGAPVYSGLNFLDLATGRVAPLTSGDLLAFFWSPEGRHLAYVLPNATEGIYSWVVLELAELRARRLVSHFPTRDMLTMWAFFDQYAYSHQVWSSDGSRLVFTGNLGLNGHARRRTGEPENQVLVADIAGGASAPVADGTLAFWPRA